MPPLSYFNWDSKKISEMEDIESKRKIEELRSFLRQDYPFLGISNLTFTRLVYGVNHIGAVLGLYFLLTGHFASWSLLLFHFVYCRIGGVGITAGAHRYWTHKSYKATLPLQIMLMLMFTSTAQYSIYKWVLDHRIHHKYTDTDKDPHNSSRGFWFSHSLWLISPKHPEHLKVLRSFDMPDLEKDPVVLFNSKYIAPITLIMSLVIPVETTVYFWGVSRFHANCLNCLRWAYNIHAASTLNSLAHMFGYRPYNKDISSADNPWVSFFSSGEGWHNYHHTFPWDYKASEMGWKVNVTTMFIDFFAWIGWAYDLKTVSKEVVHQKMMRSGDGSSRCPNEQYHDDIPKEKVTRLGGNWETEATWGWDDEDVTEEFKKMTTILKPSRRA